MEAFTQRVEEDAGSVVPDSGFLSADDMRSDSSEASSSRDHQDEMSSTSVSESVISTQKLPLYEGPEIIQRLNVFEEVELGAVIVFECQCKGNPVPTSKWYKDDVELVSSVDRVTIEDSVEADGKIRLTIQNARKSDEGAYRCKLENQEGVAATTGYLSVTGSNSSSPKSEHSISSPPLLRAITEESNASQDLDETLSTPLDKILTGEYDLTTLPYSQYLELMKENKANNALQTVSALSSEDDGRSRTSQQKSAENGDVTTDSRTDVTAVAMDTDETPTTQTRFVENNDFEMSLSSEDSTNSFDAENNPIPPRVSTYGLTGGGGGFHPVQVIRKNFGDGSEETRGDEKDSKSPILQEYNSIVAGANDDGGNGDFVGTVSSDDGKLSLAETVIAGRIGLPSDWEFAHYTQESEDNEAVFSSEHDLPYEAGNQVGAEAVAETNETPPAQIEVLPDHIQVPPQEMVLGAVSEGPVLNEDGPGRGIFPSGDSGPSERVEKVTELLEPELLQNPSNAVRDPGSVSPQGADLLPEPELSAWIGNQFDSSQTPGKVDLDQKEAVLLLEPSKVSSREYEKIPTDNELENTSKETVTSQEADKRPLGVAPPEPEVDLAVVAFPANEASVTDVGSFPVVHSDLEKSGETLPTIENFEPFSTGLLPEIPSTFTPLLPDLTTPPVQWEEPPLRLEDIEVTVLSEESLVDWCVEWFQFPWFFYVLLVLLATVVASAMQLNPALVILVVSTVSLAGFFLFPLQGVKSNKKQQ